MNLVLHYVKGFVDGLIYLFIGPFTVIGTVPILLVQLDAHLALPRFTSELSSSIGHLIMNLGAILALWSASRIFLTKGTPIPTAPATQVVKTGPYAYVRHPMMLSLLVVGIGEVLATGSLMVLAWVPIACRAGVLFVSAYEEPVLLARFGDEYRAYCAEVPRWIPRPISNLFSR
jgi:protein-S-isoprenylcysteine O-methyltransferase Ste14